MSADTGLERSARSCQIRWMNELSPGINHQPWSESEKKTLKYLLEQSCEREIDWVYVAQVLKVNKYNLLLQKSKFGVQWKTGRNPYDCIQQSLSSNTSTWTESEDKELMNAISRYGENNWQLGKK